MDLWEDASIKEYIERKENWIKKKPGEFKMKTTKRLYNLVIHINKLFTFPSRSNREHLCHGFITNTGNSNFRYFEFLMLNLVSRSYLHPSLWGSWFQLFLQWKDGRTCRHGNKKACMEMKVRESRDEGMTRSKMLLIGKNCKEVAVSWLSHLHCWRVLFFAWSICRFHSLITSTGNYCR